MKYFNRLTCLIVLGVCLTTALPILAALSLVRNQAIERQETFLSDSAKSALARSEITGDQLSTVAQVVGGMTEAEACSPNGLDIMRRLDLASTMLQAVGYVDGNVIRCSSLGGLRHFQLGPPDLISSRNAQFRTNVKLFDPNTSYLAVSGAHSIGIVHKELALSFVDKAPGMVLGVFSWSQHKLLLQRGESAPEWLGMASRGDGVFRSGDYLVAVARSKHYDLGAVAAAPVVLTTNFISQFAMVIIPLGVIVGLILSAALVHVVRNRASLPMMIRSALKNGKFHLVYQPVVDLASGRTIGAEALLRWDRGKLEDIPPDRFIPVAEQAGLISLITARVLDLLAVDARHILKSSPGFHFAVNFSAADMHRTNILAEVNNLIARSGIEFENLVVEATERSLVDVDLARETMRQLRAAGVKVAIDDFGTGYSSLRYLAQLEIDFLKIDKLFVHSLGTDAATSQVAGRIIDMAKDLDLKIVAEGIETRKQESLLKDLKVEFAQGYLFGRPMSVEDLLQRLREERVASAASAKLKAA